MFGIVANAVKWGVTGLGVGKIMDWGSDLFGSGSSKSNTTKYVASSGGMNVNFLLLIAGGATAFYFLVVKKRNRRNW